MRRSEQKTEIMNFMKGHGGRASYEQLGHTGSRTLGRAIQELIRHGFIRLRMDRLTFNYELTQAGNDFLAELAM